MKKITIIIVTLILLMFIFSNCTVKAFSLDEIIAAAEEFINKGKSEEERSGISENQVAAVIVPIAQALLAIGGVIILIVTTIMGIKYITANPEKQAALKGQLIGLVIAAVVIFGAYGIWALVYNTMIQITG